MTDFDTGAELTALWRRWRAAPRDGVEPSAPDPLLLAAYAEHRLDEASAADVEAWLAVNPERVQDVVAAQGDRNRDEVASASTVDRACDLVRAHGAEVIPFERPRRRVSGLRLVLAWGGMAASIAATGFVGFALGSDAYLSFTGDQQSQATDQDLSAPPVSLFAEQGEEPSI